MSHLKVIFVVIIASLFYATIVYSATLHTEDISNILRQRYLNDNTIRIKRAIESSKTNGTDKPPRRKCDNQACGWAVYIPFIRHIKHYIASNCRCADKSYTCIRTDDDLSMSAYVYRCRQNITENDIIAPEQIY